MGSLRLSAGAAGSGRRPSSHVAPQALRHVLRLGSWLVSLSGSCLAACGLPASVGLAASGTCGPGSSLLLTVGEGLPWVRSATIWSPPQLSTRDYTYSAAPK